MAPITILGAGSWGTTLALVLARNQQETRLWTQDAVHAKNMQRAHLNERYLPQAPFPATHLSIYHDLKASLIGVQDIIIAVPSIAFTSLLNLLRPHIQKNMRIAWGTKGLTHDGRWLHEAVSDSLSVHQAVAILSGPSLAHEVAAGLPTAISVASNTTQFSTDLRQCFHSSYFRMYRNDDLIGMELCGATKNTFAIATGISDQLGLGANARAALITRGLKEMGRLCHAIGGTPETLMGLAGIGDLVLTCTGTQSRNYRLGIAIASGHSIEHAKKDIGQAIEGLYNTPLILKLAQKLSIETPIIEMVYRILYENLSPKQAVKALLARPPSSEIG